MRHNFKTLGITLLASFAVSSAAASAASATPQFHSEAGNTTLTGSQGAIEANVLTMDFGAMKCGIATFTGKMVAATSTTLALKPKYEKCKTAGITTDVTENECAYVFHLGENTETLEAKMDLQCPDGKQLEIHAGFCTIKVPPQAGLQQVTFTNEGEGSTRRIIADLSISGFQYVEHNPPCAADTLETENGAYSGEITLGGENGAQEHVGIWVS